MGKVSRAADVIKLRQNNFNHLRNKFMFPFIHHPERTTSSANLRRDKTYYKENQNKEMPSACGKTVRAPCSRHRKFKWKVELRGTDLCLLPSTLIVAKNNTQNTIMHQVEIFL